MSFSDADPLPGSELAAFVAAVESGSVQGAADALDLTQSAATKRLQNLERRLGRALLTRGRGGAQPTELGRTLYPLAKRALQALAEIGQTAQQTAASGVQTLRLSASLTTGEFLIPAWLSAFRTEHPQIHPQLGIVNSTVVAEEVAGRRAEIGFVEGLDQLGRFEVMTVARDELRVVVAAGHRWARRRALGPDELGREAYLTRERHSGTRTVAESALLAAGVKLEPALEVSSLQSLKRAISSGGFTVISELTIEAEQRAGTLVAVPVKGVRMRRDLHAIRLPAAGHRSAPAGALWQWLQDHPAAQLSA